MSDIVVDYGGSRPQDGQASWQDWQQAAPAAVTAPAFPTAPSGPQPPAPPTAPDAYDYAYTQPPAAAPQAPSPGPVPPASGPVPTFPVEPVPAPAPADDSGFVTSRHTGGNASFARFVPDSTELEHRTASLRPASTVLLERPHTDDAAYDWGTTSEEQLAGAGEPAEAPAAGSATRRGKRPTGQIAAAVLAIAAAVVAVAVSTGAFGFGGPQQTAQTPVTPTTLVAEATPLAPDASIAQSGELAQGGLGDYPASTPTEAMVAVLGAVQGQDALLLRSVTSTSADIAAVTDIAAQIDARSATIDSARNSVVCTTSGTTATCEVPPMALGRRVAFAQGPAGWSLTGWGS